MSNVCFKGNTCRENVYELKSRRIWKEIHIQLRCQLAHYSIIFRQKQSSPLQLVSHRAAAIIPNIVAVRVDFLRKFYNMLYDGMQKSVRLL